MRTKFKPDLFLIVIPAMTGLIYFTIVLWTKMIYQPDRLNAAMITLTAFMTLTSLVLLREAKFKWNKIEITNSDLVIRPFLGLWIRKPVRLTEVTGFTESREYSKTSDGHVIYIYIQHKRSIEVSDAYCRNFHQIAEGLSGKITKLGNEKSSIVKTLLNTFGKPIKFLGK